MKVRSEDPWPDEEHCAGILVLTLYAIMSLIFRL